MAEEVAECNLNNTSFLEKSYIKKEFEGYIDVSDDRIKEYEIASTVDDMKIDLPSFEACNIVMNDNFKMETEINPEDIKIEIDNELIFSTEYEIASTVENMKIELPSSEVCHIAEHDVKIESEINPDDIKIEFDNTLYQLTQCPFCNIYFCEKEYLESHMPYCCERIVRKCIPMALDSQTVKVSRRKTKRPEMYKCTQCTYKTSYKGVLRSHLNKHYEVKMHRCEICSKHFKTKASLKLHAKYRHIDVEAEEDQKLPMRDYMNANTKARSSKVYRHSQDKTKRCSKCKFQTKYKHSLETHIKTKHFKQFNYNCEICDLKTNKKHNLEIHVKAKHLKQFSYNCEICDYKTNRKQHLEAHVKTKHLKQFSYECEMCDYKTNLKANLETHVKTRHLEQFSYECEICHHKTNNKHHLEAHVKTEHLKQFSYECEICDFKTNIKYDLERHVKAKHLKCMNTKLTRGEI